MKKDTIQTRKRKPKQQACHQPPVQPSPITQANLNGASNGHQATNHGYHHQVMMNGHLVSQQHYIQEHQVKQEAGQTNCSAKVSRNGHFLGIDGVMSPGNHHPLGHPYSVQSQLTNYYPLSNESVLHAHLNNGNGTDAGQAPSAGSPMSHSSSQLPPMVSTAHHGPTSMAFMGHMNTSTSYGHGAHLLPTTVDGRSRSNEH